MINVRLHSPDALQLHASRYHVLSHAVSLNRVVFLETSIGRPFASVLVCATH